MTSATRRTSATSPPRSCSGTPATTTSAPTWRGWTATSRSSPAKARPAVPSHKAVPATRRHHMRFIGYDFVFTEQETAALTDALLDVGASPYDDAYAFLDAVGTLHGDPRTPTRFIDFCEMSMLRDFSTQPFVVIGGAPIDPVLPVFTSEDPVTEKRTVKKTFVAEGFLALYAKLTGTEIIGHLSVNDGDLFHDIYPKPSMFDTQSQKTLKTLKSRRNFRDLSVFS